MKYTVLPNTDIKVSKICLGTMTFGNQNSEADAHEQLSYAVDKGVNFIDTAEMYAVPPSAATQGKTEEYIGNWFAKTGKREELVLATKIAGPSRGMTWIREDLSFSKQNFITALEDSLKRLQTDYVDLYQLHWPERNVNIFGQRNYSHDASEQWEDNFNQVLSVLDELVKSGKIRQVGVSNETPYGTMRFLEEAKKGLPRMITVQNPYSLLNRTYEYGMSEISMREDIGLLAYSPLGFGTLSGKYLLPNPPKDGRVAMFPRYQRYSSEQSTLAIRKYKEIADKYNMSLTHLALAFINQQPFVTSNIIGATKMSQLKENIESIHVELTTEILADIEQVHSIIPNPAP
ncbi:NADP(H)-dependent aldo-keto reductase [Pseudofulvibacter geojedonensis]|uniref:NADP(H)-dependent aldo-keto reductase n=1 Tax=Pseudofulvibacter geojedonensis TaxID=1123758 RepID=A0ABW3I3N6_9FLAO